jgi:bifunctional DNA-binding transcriptional regulator/antitoxin component of YhaV-PrlF toxin-antitoxin module
MEIIKIETNGKIKIPIEIIQGLGLQVGDEVKFIMQNGEYVLKPSIYDPLKKMQEVMKDEAEKVGWYSDDDVVEFIRELRKNKRKKNANNG